MRPKEEITALSQALLENGCIPHQSAAPASSDPRRGTYLHMQHSPCTTQQGSSSLSGEKPYEHDFSVLSISATEREWTMEVHLPHFSWHPQKQPSGKMCVVLGVKICAAQEVDTTNFVDLSPSFLSEKQGATHPPQPLAYSLFSHWASFA